MSFTKSDFRVSGDDTRLEVAQTVREGSVPPTADSIGRLALRLRGKLETLPGALRISADADIGQPLITVNLQLCPLPACQAHAISQWEVENFIRWLEPDFERSIDLCRTQEPPGNRMAAAA